MRRYLLYVPMLFVLVTHAGCSSRPHSAPLKVNWVYGRPFPFLEPIKQTAFETNFYSSVDVIIQKGLRDKIGVAETVWIDPVAAWTVFSYPVDVDLPAPSEV